jgi:hypothetical protein
LGAPKRDHFLNSKTTRKLTLFQRGADANESALPLARKVCEIFHVFAAANVFNNIQARFSSKKAKISLPFGVSSHTYFQMQPERDRQPLRSEVKSKIRRS